MGIPGLLPLLKNIQVRTTIAKYAGMTLGIDAYAWLHRASVTCPYELVMGKPTDKYLKYFIKRLDMLKKLGINPYLVFDGDYLPVKKATEFKREQYRLLNKEKALELYKLGNREEAELNYRKAVEITPEMTKCIMEYCQDNNIKYIVAPFEADPQMVYLEKLGIIQGIIAEDSDLLVFGCKRLITKLSDSGECFEIESHCFPTANDNKKFAIGELSIEDMHTLVCLSGCDYCNGIFRVGLLKAFQLIKEFHTTAEIMDFLHDCQQFEVPSNFQHEYNTANYAFKYQRVFNPITQRLTTFTPLPVELHHDKSICNSIGYAVNKFTGNRESLLDEDQIDHKLYLDISKGILNPMTHRCLNNREREFSFYFHRILHESGDFYNRYKTVNLFLREHCNSATPLLA
ncbi:exodeoxyribonuclease DIN7 [Nakaseomyces bracarensis]|uniref:exodeoxyribonuclease DIN7 n=1 Tax=Nakaseomyces bracarensis TaxID=273131 RepID=UPI0038717BA5